MQIYYKMDDIDNLSKFSDPLADYCKRKLSTSYNINDRPVRYPKGYIMTDGNIKFRDILTSPDSFIDQDGTPSPSLIDIKKYDDLQNANNMITKKSGDVAKQAYYEFSRLPKPFINISAIRLANIMESNGLSYSSYGNIRKKSNYVFNFLDLGGAPGGFSQYLLWKYPNSRGLGVSLTNGLKWQTKDLPMDRLKLWTREKGKSGNILLEWKEIGPYAARNYGVPGRDYGLDLILGGITPEIGAEKIPKTEEYLSPIILAECIIALESLRSGGNFILQVYDTVTEFTADILFLLHLVFQEVVIFRPTTVPFYNSETYVVCKIYIGLNKSKNILAIMKNGMHYINKLMSAKSETRLMVNNPITVPKRLFTEDLPPGFVKYLYGWNSNNLEFMTTAVFEIISKIIDLIEGLKGIDTENADEVALAVDRMSYADLKEKIPTNHNYNINRVLVYLNLPDLPVHLVPTYVYEAYEGDITPTNNSETLTLGNLPCNSLPCVGGKCPI